MMPKNPDFINSQRSHGHGVLRKPNLPKMPTRQQRMVKVVMRRNVVTHLAKCEVLQKLSQPLRI